MGGRHLEVVLGMENSCLEATWSVFCFLFVLTLFFVSEAVLTGFGVLLWVAEAARVRGRFGTEMRGMVILMRFASFR